MSRLLNGTSYVSADSRMAILRAIETVGYVPNAAARRLAGSPSRNIALVVHTTADLFAVDANLAGMTVGANRVLTASDHQLMIVLADDDAAIARLSRTLAGGLLDGVMLASTRLHDPLIDLVQRSGLPAVLMGHGPEGFDIPCVDVDNEHGAAEITRRLMQTGRRRIANIAGPADMRASLDRLRGFQEALGDGFDDTLVQHATGWDATAGRAAADALLARDTRFDGLVCASDAIAAGALDALAATGLRVPVDVGVVGYDDTLWARITRPALSTVAQPAEALGERMAEMIIRQLSGENLTGTVTLEPTKVIWRDSA